MVDPSLISGRRSDACTLVSFICGFFLLVVCLSRIDCYELALVDNVFNKRQLLVMLYSPFESACDSSEL